MVGRPRQFDADEALETAMRLFWSRGYKATGLSNLIAETGVAKQSLYNTFGHKKHFFLKALELYAATVAQKFREDLESGTSTIDSLRALLEGWAESARATEPYGCFITNTTTEIGKQDPEIATFLKQQAEQHEHAFESAITRAQSIGEIPSDRNAKKLARGLTATANGLMVLSKLDLPEETYHDVIDSALDNLR